MKQIRGIFILLFISCELFAQQIAQRNLYPCNLLACINPAATGVGECTLLNIADRHQWSGIENAPSLQVLSMQTGRQYAKAKKHGLGINLYRDINGSDRMYGGEVNYAFHFLVGKNHRNYLSLALSGNYHQYALDESNFSDMFDPAVTGGVDKELAYNAGWGIYFYGKKLQAGLAVYNLLPVKGKFYRGYGNERFFTTLYAGMPFTPRTKKYKLKSTLYACSGQNFRQFDLHNEFRFQNKFWFALTFRKYIGQYTRAGQNLLVYAGYEEKKWSFSYAYDIGINGLILKHFGSHQFSIGYKICPDKYKCKAY